MRRGARGPKYQTMQRDVAGTTLPSAGDFFQRGVENSVLEKLCVVLWRPPQDLVQSEAVLPAVSERVLPVVLQRVRGRLGRRLHHTGLVPVRSVHVLLSS